MRMAAACQDVQSQITFRKPLHRRLGQVKTSTQAVPDIEVQHLLPSPLHSSRKKPTVLVLVLVLLLAQSLWQVELLLW